MINHPVIIASHITTTCIKKEKILTSLSSKTPIKSPVFIISSQVIFCTALEYIRTFIDHVLDVPDCVSTYTLFSESIWIDIGVSPLFESDIVSSSVQLYALTPWIISNPQDKSIVLNSVFILVFCVKKYNPPREGENSENYWQKQKYREFNHE